MAFKAALQRTMILAFVSVSIIACSTSQTRNSAVPESRKPAFTNSQPGNGGCTDVFGCNIQVLCWDGSEPDPFTGGCPPVPQGSGQPTPQPPGCDISAATVNVTPLPRNRTTLGVGEQVALSSSDGSTWSVSGDGSLDNTSGGSVTFTAGDTAGTATVTVSAQGCLASGVTYTVIAPSGLLYAAVNGIKHTQGLADIGMQANAYLQPDSVSFKGLAYKELDAVMSASGPYACLDGYGHQPYASPLVGNYDTVAGLGTPITTDTIESGSCTGLDQFSNGTASVNIPEIYMVGLGGADHRFSVVQHIATASAGSLTIKKGGASRSTTVNSPTSSY